MPFLFCLLPAFKIPEVRTWRKYIICLLLVTIPMSLWAAVAAPQDCGLSQSSEQTQSDDDAHAHHDMGTSPPAEIDLGVSQGVPVNPDAPHDCCDFCLTACLASGHSVLNLPLAALEPLALPGHFNNTLASQFLPGPSYPSLYRPPISQI